MAWEEDDYESDTEGVKDNEDSKNNMLKQLPLYHFYDVLNNENDYVDSGTDSCAGYATNSLNKYSQFIHLCKVLHYKRSKFPNIIEQCDNVPKTKRCEYMTYWLRNKIEDIDPNFPTNSMLHVMFSMIFTSIFGNDCVYDKNKFSNVDFPLRKKYFDYTENLQSINDLGRKFTDLNDYFYCEYIADGIKAYNEVIEHDSCNRASCTYFKELENFKNKFKSLQSSLNEKCGNNLPCLKKNKEEYEHPCTSKRVSFKSTEPTYMGLSGLPDSEQGVSVSTIITPVISLFGISFILFILYKFTPFGSLLRRHIMKEKNFYDNVDEETDNRLHNSQFCHQDSDKRLYTIQYHSTRNS
ncbi:PIR Superfamily Protein [Plasmodium ovale wallikeri]|uniref:PIR Superfamily Protein n=2 Tax=Plasmodium ovale TaxID=36330 RepID=A0A1A9ASL6_PLAOA|nr:PIR Superfamily Protein [Plasmodium ovale wallikeri]SBT59114.1 PIR Superfamily Protein [Plasmodium ovale wallikeri]SBT72192.1 PIR protein [Plasmodium ovale]